MRKIKLNQLLIQFLTLIPKLAGLQILWFIASLPLFTVFSATRTLTERLSYMGKQIEEEPTSFFFDFRQNVQKYWKKDVLLSIYLLLLLIDRQIFLQMNTHIGAVLMSAATVLCLMSVVLFVYHVLCTLENEKQKFLVSFVLFWRSPLFVCASFASIAVCTLFLRFVGPVYFMLLGVSLPIYAQIALKHFFQTRKVKKDRISFLQK
ncbi:hypothetical protein D920_00600 [Enterococcus faecalis 13-SD-W-01]|nr:hypothetical protein D920_00600 [Enterococcus faecalis 13-SD-W-01]